MKNLILVFLITILLCCQTTNSKQINLKQCDSIDLEIKSNWKYSEELKHFITSKSFIKNLNSKFRDCLIGLSQKKIINYFGKPSVSREFKKERFKYSIEYLISPPCLNENTPKVDCLKFEFYFDSNFNVIDFMETGSFGNMQK